MVNKKMSNKMHTQNIDILPITTLDEISVGSSCVIESCSLPQALKLRLEEMGLTKGAELTVLKIAPLGDPMQIYVRGYALCIRKSVAHRYTVHRTRE